MALIDPGRPILHACQRLIATVVKNQIRADDSAAQQNAQLEDNRRTRMGTGGEPDAELLPRPPR